jgi:alkanesulfonate monooxygenase SsuD/methylene tetrahydromethanopterin reductase-like flavin-dependent oxidoreductase (luciferase family)
MSSYVFAEGEFSSAGRRLVLKSALLTAAGAGLPAAAALAGQGSSTGGSLMTPSISGAARRSGPLPKHWTVSSDPDAHVQTIQKLFDSGATIVNIHSGQPDQQSVIEFYGKEVLPRIKKSVIAS